MSKDLTHTILRMDADNRKKILQSSAEKDEPNDTGSSLSFEPADIDFYGLYGETVLP